MPPKRKRPGRPPGSKRKSANKGTTTSNRRKRGHTTDNSKRDVKTSKSKASKDNDESKSKQEKALNEAKADIMYAIPHHTAFIPSLQCPNPLITQNQSLVCPGGFNSTNSSNHNHNTCNKSNSNGSKSINSSNKSNNDDDSIDYASIYNLYHPRNLGAQSMPNVQSDQPPPPHSAGCRLSSISCPSWTPVAQSTITSSTTNTTTDTTNTQTQTQNTNKEIVKCTTVMNSNSEYVVMGDTSGYVTVYSILPLFRPITVLSTTNSARCTQNDIRSNNTARKTKRIGVTDNILMSSIDRMFAIDAIAVNSNGVVVGTRQEVEFISFEDEILWSLDIFGVNGADGIEGKDDLIRDAPLHFDIGSGGILTSFELHHKPNKKRVTSSTSSVSASTSTSCTEDQDESTTTSTTTTTETGVEGDKELGNEMNETPNLSSPIWHIDSKTGKAKSVAPREYVDNTWHDVIIGHKAMAIWDKSISYANNILAVFITQNRSTKEIQQELMLLNNSQQVIFRADLPTKSSSSKIVTCEAISQSQRGTFTIAATSARGGIRLFRTDGLAHLGTYGEGVSLHGHSIFWQSCFFIEMGSVNNGYVSQDAILDKNNNENKEKGSTNIDTSSDQEQWGQIFDRHDELQHRGNCKIEEIERIKAGEEESLKGLHIVSVPHAFREPVDMKETIHFWDVTTCELDKGNTLPSFTLAAPKKSNGIINLLYDRNFPTSLASRFILSTHSGECVQLTPTMTSDWAGQMYPAGYRVIDNNLVYIEDEDELDKVIDTPIESDALLEQGCWGETVKTRRDIELEKALRISEVDEYIDVVNDDKIDAIDPFFPAEITDPSEEEAVSFPPCRPEPHLKEKLKEERNSKNTMTNDIGSIEDDASGRSEAIDLLRLFPQEFIVKDLLKTEKEKSEKRKLTIEAKLTKVDETIKEKTPKPRSRLANIEVLMKASIDKQLSISMIERENFSGTSGSMFIEAPAKKADKVIKKKKDVNCAACRGRKVIHTCGKRVKPIDYFAIEKARKEKEAKIKQEKLDAQAKKRREADAKRREAKRKQKEDEKLAKLEEERIQKEMVKQAQNALAGTQSSFHDETDTYSPQHQHSNFFSHSYDAESNTPTQAYHNNGNYHNDDESGHGSYFNNHVSESNSPHKHYNQNPSTPNSGSHQQNLNSDQPEHVNHNSSESDSHQDDQYYQQQENETDQNSEQFHHEQSNGNSYYDQSQQYYSQEQSEPNNSAYQKDSSGHHYNHDQYYQTEQSDHNQETSMEQHAHQQDEEHDQQHQQHYHVSQNNSMEQHANYRQHEEHAQQHQQHYHVSQNNSMEQHANQQQEDHEQQHQQYQQHYHVSQNHSLEQPTNQQQEEHVQQHQQHYHVSQNHSMEQHTKQQHEEHAQQHQQHYHVSQNNVNSSEQNQHWDGHSNNYPPNYQSGHQSYNYNDDAHHYEPHYNLNSNVNGSSYYHHHHQNQHTPYYQPREIPTGDPNSKFSSNNNLHHG